MDVDGAEYSKKVLAYSNSNATDSDALWKNLKEREKQYMEKAAEGD